MGNSSRRFRLHTEPTSPENQKKVLLPAIKIVNICCTFIKYQKISSTWWTLIESQLSDSNCFTWTRVGWVQADSVWRATFDNRCIVYIIFVGKSDRIIGDQKRRKEKNPSVFPKPQYVQSIGLDVLAGQITPRNAYLTHDNHSCSNTNSIIQKIVITMNNLNDNW